MKPKQVKINGELFTGFTSVELSGAAPPDAYGCPQATAAQPFTASLVRQLNQAPGTTAFELATGTDGRLQELQLEIDLENGRRLTHTIELSDAYLASFSVSDGGQGAQEHWVVQAGRVKLTAGGSTETFQPDWRLIPGGSR